MAANNRLSHSGCGGNAIALAKVFDIVIASDIDAKKLEMLRYILH